MTHMFELSDGVVDSDVPLEGNPDRHEDGAAHGDALRRIEEVGEEEGVEVTALKWDWKKVKAFAALQPMWKVVKSSAFLPTSANKLFEEVFSTKFCPRYDLVLVPFGNLRTF